jgi:hypothetical protein
MKKPLPILIEECVEIAWDYLERSGQIDDPEWASSYLLNYIETWVRTGERRQLLLTNRAIAAYEQVRTLRKAA